MDEPQAPYSVYVQYLDAMATDQSAEFHERLDLRPWAASRVHGVTSGTSIGFRIGRAIDGQTDNNAPAAQSNNRVTKVARQPLRAASVESADDLGDTGADPTAQILPEWSQHPLINIA